MKKFGLCMCLVVGAISLLRAQPMPKDTVHVLPEFSTNTVRFEQFAAGRKTTHTDSLVKQVMAATSLAQLLAVNSQLFVKSYGVGQLATTSFRGAGASHTAILWNGINLQSTMHGQSDFNLIPVGLMDEVDVYYGGNSALFGGGAIGGAVALQNKGAYQQRRISYGVTVGSFAAQQHWLSVSQGNAKAYFTVKAYGLQARNNITYQNTALAHKPTETLAHAEQVGYGVLVDAGKRITPKQELKLKYWYGFSDRNLPPTMGAGVSHSYQIDASHRALGEWNYQTTRAKVTTRLAWLREYINYQDPSTYITGKSTANTYVMETEINRVFTEHWSANAGVNNTYTTANSEGYAKLAERNTTALFASVKYSGIKKVVLTGSVRNEWIYGNTQPFTATLGADYKLPHQFMLGGQINKSYRLPTLNDLYWITGNKNLQAEHGYGQEVSVKKQLSNAHTFVVLQVNAFNRWIDDWIIWQPLAGTWTPQNLKQVWSRGLEWNGRYTYCKNKWSVSVKTDWSYVLSTNQRANSATDATVGKQLIYTPRLMHQHLLTYMYDKFYFAINPTYTGYRFTSSDNSTYINDYTVTNVFAGYGSAYRNVKWQVRLQVNNCFNQAYQVLPARPMPLRNWQLTLQLTY